MAGKKKTAKGGKKGGFVACVALVALIITPSLATRSEAAGWSIETGEPKLLIGFSFKSLTAKDPGETYQLSYTPALLAYSSDTERIFEIGRVNIGLASPAGTDQSSQSRQQFNVAVSAGIYQAIYPTIGWVRGVPQADGSERTERRFMLLADGMKVLALGQRVLGSAWALTGL